MALSLASLVPGVVASPLPGRPLDVTTLRRAGILGDPDRPEVALRRAQRLIEQGDYFAARALLYPQRNRAPIGMRARIHELLGVCAAYGGGDWKQLFDTALATHRELGDEAGVARVNRHVGEMLLISGDFRRADEHLASSEEIYTRLGDVARLATTGTARARLRMRVGRMRQALELIDQALAALAAVAQPRVEGLARLDRARILAHMGDSSTAARELITADRLLVAIGNGGDHLRARLVRAETLIIVGEQRRAAAGLLHLAADVNAGEDVPTRAWYNELLGAALAEDEPAEARRHLMRARHLYTQIQSELGVATCEVILARVERSLGLEPSARIKALRIADAGRWPLVAAELRLVRAELAASSQPELARQQVLEVRAFAAENGNTVLVRRCDQALVELRLVTAEELGSLKPAPRQRAAPIVHGGATVTHLAAPPGGPQPMEVASQEELSLELSRRRATLRTRVR